MKVKVLKIRIDDSFIRTDQQKLDKFLADHQIVKFESAFIRDEECWSVILYYEDRNPILNEEKPEKYSANNDEELNTDEVKILDSLRLWRNTKAKEQNLPSYFIATNKELISIAKYKPAKKEELQEIKGFGKHKIENYGEEIIGLVESV
ncbi:MAG: HRDC domain-containing protein [Weeksellaceae bacterium]|nr:HRDC domain-containing protein [Weeksellaceae bacterium]